MTRVTDEKLREARRSLGEALRLLWAEEPNSYWTDMTKEDWAVIEAALGGEPVPRASAPERLLYEYRCGYCGAYEGDVDPDAPCDGTIATWTETDDQGDVWLRTLGTRIQVLVGVGGTYRVAIEEPCPSDLIISHNANLAYWKEWPEDEL